MMATRVKSSAEFEPSSLTDASRQGLESRKELFRTLGELEDADGDSSDDKGAMALDLSSRMDIDDPEARDESEEELERLVFGDSAGFRKGVSTFSLAGAKGGEREAGKDEEEDLAHVPDEQLFFFDSGAGAAHAAVAPPRTAEEDGEQPAWEDSDDERLVVRLSSLPVLRKLRETEEEDAIDGQEYIRRA